MQLSLAGPARDASERLRLDFQPEVAVPIHLARGAGSSALVVLELLGESQVTLIFGDVANSRLSQFLEWIFAILRCRFSVVAEIPICKVRDQRSETSNCQR